MTFRLHDPDHIVAAADAIARGEVVGFFFNGAYALLGDVDQDAAAERIFVLKRRPRTQTLSLVTDPRFWPPFVDLDASAVERFPMARATSLYRALHALGIIYPADPDGAPRHLTQNGTILNVWTRYGPLIALQEACRDRGVRAMLGASANPSGEATYTTADQMHRGFGRALPMVFAEESGLAPARRNSTSMLDLTGDEPTLLREGNTSEAEVRAAVAEAGLGRLVVAAEVTRL